MLGYCGGGDFCSPETGIMPAIASVNHVGRCWLICGVRSQLVYRVLGRPHLWFLRARRQRRTMQKQAHSSSRAPRTEPRVMPTRAPVGSGCEGPVLLLLPLNRLLAAGQEHGRGGRGEWSVWEAWGPGPQ